MDHKTLSDDTLPRAARRANHRLYSCRRPEWVTNQVFNTLSHLLSAIIYLLLLPEMISVCRSAGRTFSETAFVVACHMSVFNIFLASSVYHSVGLSGISFRVYQRTRMWDHMSIFVGLITAVLTIATLVLHSAKGNIVVLATLIGGTFGIAAKLRARERQKTSAFVGSLLAIGWVPAIILPDLSRQLGRAAMLALLRVGGAFTAGALVYATRRLTLVRGVLGSHELWHAMTILGFYFLHVFLRDFAIPLGARAAE